VALLTWLRAEMNNEIPIVTGLGGRPRMQQPHERMGGSGGTSPGDWGGLRGGGGFTKKSSYAQKKNGWGKVRTGTQLGTRKGWRGNLGALPKSKIYAGKKKSFLW